MTENDQKMLFSVAYLKAVASVAGFVVVEPSLDRDSVDAVVCADKGFHTLSPSIELQLKCTADLLGEGDDFAFELDPKNYDDLRLPSCSPRYLVVVTVPKHRDAWLVQSDQCLSLFHAGYYLSLAGMPAKKNKSSVTVRIPRAQVLTASALQSLMKSAAERIEAFFGSDIEEKAS